MTDIDKVSLMIIDDDHRFRDRLKQSFDRRGYDVSAFADGVSALEEASQNSPELALVDLRLQGEWGLNIVKGLLEIDPETHIVVLTAYGSIATAIEAVRLGAKNYLQKPVSIDEIERALLDQPSDDVTQHEHDSAQLPSLAKVEWEYINRILTECDGNIRKTASLLGMHRRTLQRKLAKFPTKT